MEINDNINAELDQVESLDKKNITDAIVFVGLEIREEIRIMNEILRKIYERI